MLHDGDWQVRQLSKLMSKLLRHSARALSVPMSDDGWCALPDVLAAVNGGELRDVLGSRAELSGVVFDEDSIRRVVPPPRREP